VRLKLLFTEKRMKMPVTIKDEVDVLEDEGT
jgi:hypothetical protein